MRLFGRHRVNDVQPVSVSRVAPTAIPQAAISPIATEPDANARLNAIAGSIQSSRVEFIPLSVRYTAAKQAHEFVQAWLDEDW